MKFKWNVLLQILGAVGQFVNITAPFVPGGAIAQVGMAVTIAAVQGGVSAYAHYSNPDGSTSAVAYRP